MTNDNSIIIVISRFDFYYDDIKERLKDLTFDIYYFKSIEEFLSKGYEKSRVKFIFFPHYSKLISKEVFDEYFCVGFHTGNLPNDRGGSPIQNKIINGEYITKVSAFRISEEIDSGEIYADKLIDLSNGTIKDILHQISQKIADMVREIAIEVPLGKQQTEGIIRFSRINEESSSLNLDNLDLRQIYDRIRMVDGYEYPKAYIEFETYYLILFDAHLYDDKLTGRCEIIPK